MADESALPLEVSAIEAKRLLAAEGAAVRLIDVRDPDEYAICRLPGSELIPLQTISSEAAARLPDKEAAILVYCHHGMRSAHAADYLRQRGYIRAQSIAGGVDGWSREIDPTLPRY